MTQSHRLARDPALAAAFAFACVLTGCPSPGEAGKTKSNPPQAPQSAPAPASEAVQEADQKKQAAVAARQAYDAGLKAFANGKYQPAVDQLSAAVKGGGLSSAEIAKALYTRGAAYKKQNKPGLAISDLTSALWLKNGLTGTDRQKATAERAEAYNMAGLQESGDASERAVVDNPNSSARSSSAGLSAAAVAQAAASQSQPASANASGASGAAPAASGPVTRQDAESDAAKDAARARAAYGTVDGGGLQAAATATVVRSPANRRRRPSPQARTRLQWLRLPRLRPWLQPLRLQQQVQRLQYQASFRTFSAADRLRRLPRLRNGLPSPRLPRPTASLRYRAGAV